MKNSNELLKVSLPALVIVVLFVFVTKFGLTKVSEINVLIQKEIKTQTALNQKLKLLSAVSTSLGNDAGSASVSLPDANPALTTISQLKTLASTNQISIISLKVGGEVKDTSGLLRTDIAFEVEGSKSEILKYVDGISTFAPITIVDKVKISEIAGSTRANVTVKAFWAPLPKTLPSISSELTDLTETELSVMATIEKLTPPLFVVSSPSQNTEVRTDPFIQ